MSRACWLFLARARLIMRLLKQVEDCIGEVLSVSMTAYGVFFERINFQIIIISEPNDYPFNKRNSEH